MKNYLQIKISVLSFLLLLIVSTELVGASGIVTVKGMSFFEEGRELVAREKALDEAKRAAIEQALGSKIESRTFVKDSQLVSDQILSHASGYLKNIKIIEERKTDFGVYEITIQAEVKEADMKNDLDRFRQIVAWQKNPRVCIEIDRRNKKDYLPLAWKISGFMTDKLKQNGFSVLECDKYSEDQMGLVIAIGVEVARRNTSYQDLQITLNEISLNTEIHRPGDREILATASAVKSMPGDNTISVLDKAMKLCVSSVWNDLVEKLTRTWEKELYGERTLTLIAKGMLSHAKALEIASVIKSDVSSISDVKLIQFREKTSKYSIKYKGWPEHFANEIQMSYFQNKYFKSKVEDVSGNKITITITATN